MATTNIVRLPSAPSRKVRQYWNKATRANRADLREQSPWPGEYRSPWDRERDRKEAEQRDRLRGLCRSPELAIMLAMLQTMPSEQVDKIAGILSRKAGQTPDDDDMRAAAALAQEASDMRMAAEKMAALYSTEAQS